MFRLGWLMAIGACFVLVVLLALGLFSPFGPVPGWGNYGYGWSWTGGFWFPFFPMMGVGMLAFCVLMLGGGGRHRHSFTGCSTGHWIPRQNESLSDLLRRRYSQGEITREQFEEVEHTLSVSDADSADEPADHQAARRPAA